MIGGILIVEGAETDVTASEEWGFLIVWEKPSA
jgi:hypothetical protein